MGLHITKVPPALTDDWDLNDPKTMAMVYATMFVDWGEITEEDYVRWFARVSTYEKVVGPILQTAGGEPNYLTLDDVKSYVGLRTNVAYLPDVQFAQKMYGMVQDIIRAELHEAGVDVKQLFDAQDGSKAETIYTVVAENGTYEDIGRDYMTITFYTSAGQQFAPREYHSRELMDNDDGGWDPSAIEDNLMEGIVKVINKL